MNNLQVTLTESTIEKFLRSRLEGITFENQEKELRNENGVKIVANVHVRKVEFNDFVLTAPDVFSINKILVEFEKLNVVVSVDIKHYKNENVIVTPDIPEVRVGPVVITPRREVPDIVLWRIDIFGENPDVQLTMGLENILKPEFSTSFKFNTNDFKVTLSLADFQVHNFVIPDSIGDELKKQVIEEITNKIKEKIDNKFLDEIMDILEKGVKLFPVPDFSGLINQALKSKEFEDFVKNQVNSKLGDYVLYVPANFKLGPNESPIELSIESPVVSINDHQVTISVNVNEL
ncbi:hypothetical protein [Paenibacillus caseinilyticus]|uniref:hypothetical protein n=1 Tax=Paenibacillus caseinilyticus TaxID=3098138 RepID=UPI0022B8D8D4|nr:hypothetical protein [Paenibacillus caseinilyticus]MCZ8518868.1 hypothetical protein [Paenibacillus caseinilyticus]